MARSVRQGCSLSPLLYILCLETVLRKTREDKEIKGVKIPDQIKEQKCSAYADDSNFFLTNEQHATFWQVKKQIRAPFWYLMG